MQRVYELRELFLRAEGLIETGDKLWSSSIYECVTHTESVCVRQRAEGLIRQGIFQWALFQWGLDAFPGLLQWAFSMRPWARSSREGGSRLVRVRWFVQVFFKSPYVEGKLSWKSLLDRQQAEGLIEKGYNLECFLKRDAFVLSYVHHLDLLHALIDISYIYTRTHKVSVYIHTHTQSECVTRSARRECACCEPDRNTWCTPVSHVTYGWVMSCTHELCHTWTSHITHEFKYETQQVMNFKSRCTCPSHVRMYYTHEWVMSNTNESCHTWITTTYKLLVALHTPLKPHRGWLRWVESIKS